jgi:hypothetical protein
MSAEDGYCSTGTDSPRADSEPAADADSPGGGQSKRDHPSPSSTLPPPKRRYILVQRFGLYRFAIQDITED